MSDIQESKLTRQVNELTEKVAVLEEQITECKANVICNIDELTEIIAARLCVKTILSVARTEK